MSTPADPAAQSSAYGPAPASAPGTAPASAPDPRTPAIAGPGIRAGAFVIDVAAATLATLALSFLLVIVGALLLGTVGAANYGIGIWFAGIADLGIAATRLLPLGAAVLYAVHTSKRGSSIGHRMLGLQVVDLDTRTLVPLRRGMLRTLVLFAPAILLLALQVATGLLGRFGGTLAYSSGAYTLYRAATILVPLAVVVTLIWWAALLVQVASGHRALHDRVANTMVLAWKVRPTAP